ncbi:hypothetical protein [Novosphingobium sp. 9U]|uniref:hypothetical protein n=1 Tax=Novosphingobium sp. 9U TaxID=2653158 RepID=UPI00135A3C75|nr:hypothetical protein [Novosphingobium sp. 9U]
MIDEAMGLGTLGTIGGSRDRFRDALMGRDLFSEAMGMSRNGKIGIASGAFAASQQAINDGIASAMPNTLGIGRSLSELFSQAVSGTSFAALGRNSAFDALMREATEHTSTRLGRALVGNYQDHLGMFSKGQSVGLTSINEALKLSLDKYDSVFSIAGEIGKRFASQHQSIVDQIAGIPSAQTVEFARLLKAFDVGDWRDVRVDIDANEANEADELRSKLLDILLHIIVRLNPVKWGPGEYLAILMFAYQIMAPDFTEEDHKNLVAARREATAAHSTAELTVKGINELKEGVAAEEAYLEQVSALPKGTIIGRGIVRSDHSKSSPQVALLARDDTVAIAAREGKWLCIIYSDPLTKTFGQGWIWGGAVDAFDE